MSRVRTVCPQNCPCGEAIGTMFPGDQVKLYVTDALDARLLYIHSQFGTVSEPRRRFRRRPSRANTFTRGHVQADPGLVWGRCSQLSVATSSSSFLTGPRPHVGGSRTLSLRKHRTVPALQRFRRAGTNADSAGDILISSKPSRGAWPGSGAGQVPDGRQRLLIGLVGMFTLPVQPLIFAVALPPGREGSV